MPCAWVILSTRLHFTRSHALRLGCNICCGCFTKVSTLHSREIHHSKFDFHTIHSFVPEPWPFTSTLCTFNFINILLIQPLSCTLLFIWYIFNCLKCTLATKVLASPPIFPSDFSWEFSPPTKLTPV